MLRWGVAGCGWVARDFVAPAIAASSNGRVAALYDISLPNLVTMAAAHPDAEAHSNLAEFLQTSDALYVATPNDMHRPLVEAAAAAGVPVLCEKPMATTAGDARAMVLACARAEILYATAFDQRFHPAHLHIAKLIRAGVLGTVTAIRIVYCCWLTKDFQSDNWRVDPARAGGGALMDLAPHGLDLASTLLGDRLGGIAAIGQSLVQDYDVEDGAMLLARSEAGVLVQLHVAYNCPGNLPRRRLEIVGTLAQIVATDTMGQTPGGSVQMIDAATGQAELLVVPDSDRSPFLNQVEAFARAVQHGIPFGFDPADDLHIMELVACAQLQANPWRDTHRHAA